MAKYRGQIQNQALRGAMNSWSRIKMCSFPRKELWSGPELMLPFPERITKKNTFLRCPFKRGNCCTWHRDRRTFWRIEDKICISFFTPYNAIHVLRFIKKKIHVLRFIKKKTGLTKNLVGRRDDPPRVQADDIRLVLSKPGAEVAIYKRKQVGAKKKENTLSTKKATKNFVEQPSFFFLIAIVFSWILLS